MDESEHMGLYVRGKPGVNMAHDASSAVVDAAKYCIGRGSGVWDKLRLALS